VKFNRGEKPDKDSGVEGRMTYDSAAEAFFKDAEGNSLMLFHGKPV
jgi:hypothetical protein